MSEFMTAAEMAELAEMDAAFEERDIEVITEEINFYKRQAGSAILEIGKRLVEAKAQLSHGEWLPWLEEKVAFSERSAQQYMRLWKEYGKSALSADLSISKALVLLALPESEREDFTTGTHSVNGEEKTVSAMTVKELEKAIAERILREIRTRLGFLRSVGLSGLTRTWLADPSLALGCLIFVNIWQWTGYSMLLYYASMLNISEDLYEAASIDGAGKVSQFFRITLPLLRSTHFTVFILGALGSLKCYDIAYVLTGGGPNHATETFSTYIQEFAFSTFKQGRASTLVVFMFLIAMVITAAQLVLYYRGD